MSKQIYEELVAAGAPRLPAGQFYDITDESEYAVEIRVRLRKHRKNWFPKTLVEATIEQGYVPWTLQSVANACAKVVGEYERGQEPRPDHLGDLRKYIGRHP